MAIDGETLIFRTLPTAWPTLIDRFPLPRVPAAVGAAAVVALSLAAWWVRVAIDAYLPPGFPFLTFFPVVIVASFLFGARLGTLAAVVCGVISGYWFVPPLGSFQLTSASAVAMLFYVFICATDIALIHWMQRTTRHLGAQREVNARLAQTRELLFRELQHRVSNNLQMVAALLALQKRQISDGDARDALDEASRRLGTIGRISRQLYDPAGRERDLRTFLDELARDVIDASGRDGVSYRVEGSADGVVKPDTAIALALIVAEAVANAIEHGFDARPTGEVVIRLARPGPGRLSVEVEDDGHGLPAGFSIDGNPSLGLQITTLLAQQMRGSYSLVPGVGGGAVARLDLPIAT